MTVSCLHPATFMPAKMVAGYAEPQSSVTDGVRAVMRLIISPAPEKVTGRYYDGLLEAMAAAAAYAAAARRRRRELSDQLTGMFGRA